MLYALELAPFSFVISDWHLWAFFFFFFSCGPKEFITSKCSGLLHLSNLLLCLSRLPLSISSEMSVRMSNLDNERDDRDEDSHEDRGISKIPACLSGTDAHKWAQTTHSCPFCISNYTEVFYVHQICSIILTINAVFHWFSALDIKWMIILEFFVYGVLF